MTYYEPGARTLGERVEELSCLHTLLTLVDCSGLRGRVSHYYREGSLRPPCAVESENNALCLKLALLRYSDRQQAQALLSQHNEARREAQRRRDAGHVWRLKQQPALPISRDFRAAPSPADAGHQVDWQAIVDESS